MNARAEEQYRASPQNAPASQFVPVPARTEKDLRWSPSKKEKKLAEVERALRTGLNHYVEINQNPLFDQYENSVESELSQVKGYLDIMAAGNQPKEGGETLVAYNNNGLYDQPRDIQDTTATEESKEGVPTAEKG